MRPSPEISIDLDAEDLLAPAQPTAAPTAGVELEDISTIDPQSQPADAAAQPADLIELELSAEEMDAMLETGWQPRSVTTRKQDRSNS